MPSDHAAARLSAATTRLAAALLLAAHAPHALATTKGLSQIVTPDLQPQGELSLSAQVENRAIGNPRQLQLELGLSRWLEVAAFQGLAPGEQIFGAQLGLVQQERWLLTSGFVNWSTRNGSPQPFLEAGYYTPKNKFMAGPIRVRDRTELLLGWAHDFNPTWRLQLDFQSGRENYATLGFTCTLSAHWQFNPALYVANDSSHARIGYLVVTYTLPVGSRR